MISVTATVIVFSKQIFRQYEDEAGNSKLKNFRSVSFSKALIFDYVALS